MTKIGKNNLLTKIGRECGQWRNDHGLTLQDVGDLVDMSRQAVSKFEKGESDSACLLYAYQHLGFPGEIRNKGERLVYFRIASPNGSVTDFPDFDSAARRLLSRQELGCIGDVILMVDLLTNMELFEVKS